MNLLSAAILFALLFLFWKKIFIVGGIILAALIVGTAVRRRLREKRREQEKLQAAQEAAEQDLRQRSREEAEDAEFTVLDENDETDFDPENTNFFK